MKINIMENKDKIEITNGIITFLICGNIQSYPLSEIDSMTLFLNDIKSDGNDMSLSVCIGNNTVVIPSDYDEFEDLLLNKFCLLLPMDMSAVVQALSCTEKGEFLIYRR